MFSQTIENLAKSRIACVGDVMLDHFVYGAVARISPEAPIPILVAERQVMMLGGAGNVVRNLAALGAASCFFGVIGDDGAGRDILRLLSDEKSVEPHLVLDATRQTTVKTRYIAGQQQILRVDRESREELASDLQDSLFQRVHSALGDYDLLVLSDYAKGVINSGSPPLSRRLIDLAKKLRKKVIIDPKGDDYALYHGADIVTPNRRELELASHKILGHDHRAIEDAARQVM